MTSEICSHFLNFEVFTFQSNTCLSLIGNQEGVSERVFHMQQCYLTRDRVCSQIVEVFPSSTKELTPGTRLCAYWSEQYRCLYPGTAVEPIEPNTDHDDKYVSVEFDDGDSGRIDLSNIRLLPAGYPVIGTYFLTRSYSDRNLSLTYEDKSLPCHPHYFQNTIRIPF